MFRSFLRRANSSSFLTKSTWADANSLSIYFLFTSTRLSTRSRSNFISISSLSFSDYLILFCWSISSLSFNSLSINSCCLSLNYLFSLTTFILSANIQTIILFNQGRVYHDINSNLILFYFKFILKYLYFILKWNIFATLIFL